MNEDKKGFLKRHKISYRHIYIIGGTSFATVLLFFDALPKFSCPLYPLVIFIFILLFSDFDFMWAAISKGGMVSTTNLKEGEGSCEGVHPSDIIMTAYKKGSPCFAAVAQGGFVNAGVEWHGCKRFIVCPSAYVKLSTGKVDQSAANLRQVNWDDLPREAQEVVSKLRRFSIAATKWRHNLWFGITSSYYDHDSAEDIDLQNTYITNTEAYAKLQHKLDEMLRTGRTPTRGGWPKERPREEDPE